MFKDTNTSNVNMTQNIPQNSKYASHVCFEILTNGKNIEEHCLFKDIKSIALFISDNVEITVLFKSLSHFKLPYTFTLFFLRCRKQYFILVCEKRCITCIQYVENTALFQVTT